jgi:hypothetical protein
MWTSATNAAISMDPNFAHAYAEKGHILALSGRAQEAIEPTERPPSKKRLAFSRKESMCVDVRGR